MIQGPPSPSGRRRGFSLIEVLVVIAIIGLLLGLLLPAAQRSREAARRAGCQNNLKQIGLALLRHHEARGAFPAAGQAGGEARLAAGWRVEILPYLEQKPLYDSLQSDHPGESGRSVADLMPPVYACPSAVDEEPGLTHYQAIVGRRAAFLPGKGLSLRDFGDGASRTILVAEARDGEPWSQPGDLPFERDAAELVDRVGDEPHPGGFHALFADGSVRLLPSPIDPTRLTALITRNGGEAGE